MSKYSNNAVRPNRQLKFHAYVASSYVNVEHSVLILLTDCSSSSNSSRSSMDADAFDRRKLCCFAVDSYEFATKGVGRF